MSATATTVAAAAGTGALQTFEGFLKRAGRLAGVVLSEISKLALPLTSLLSAISPKMPGPEAAFVAAAQLIGNAVIAVAHSGPAAGPATGAQKLADVLVLIEQPVLALFADAGLAVDTGYVINLVNGIVALLNAQPGDLLGVLGSGT